MAYSEFIRKDYYCGIDLGNNGWITMLDKKGIILNMWPVPYITYSKGGKGFDGNVLRGFLHKLPKNTVCICEYMTIFNKMPEGQHQRARQLIHAQGYLEGQCMALEIPVRSVTPRSWQSYFKFLTKAQYGSAHGTGKDENATKKQSMALVLEIYGPDIIKSITGKKLSHDMADSILIAEWFRANSEGVTGYIR